MQITWCSRSFYFWGFHVAKITRIVEVFCARKAPLALPVRNPVVFTAWWKQKKLKSIIKSCHRRSLNEMMNRCSTFAIKVSEAVRLIDGFLNARQHNWSTVFASLLSLWWLTRRMTRRVLAPCVNFFSFFAPSSERKTTTACQIIFTRLATRRELLIRGSRRDAIQANVDGRRQDPGFQKALKCLPINTLFWLQPPKTSLNMFARRLATLTYS